MSDAGLAHPPAWSPARSTAARCMVPRLPWHPVVDRAARAEGLAVRQVPSARPSASRGGQVGRGGDGGRAAVRVAKQRITPPTRRKRCYPLRMQRPACHAPLADDAPICRISLSSVRYVCRPCAEQRGGTWKRWHEPIKCGGCGRPMVFDANRVIPEIVACGPDCRRAVRAARARERRARRRNERHCGDCGRLFTPQRTDGRFCSSACRLRAHRRRQHAEAA
jgi:hypothetical protein